VERSARRRRSVQLVVGADGTVVVRAPLRLPLRDIEAFVRERAGWVQERLTALAAAPPRASHAFEDGEVLLVDGVDTPLQVVVAIGRPRPVVALAGDALRLGCAFGATAEQRRQWLAHWYHERTAERAAVLVAGWMDIMDVRPADLIVRDQKRRWGSCSPTNVIRLNWRLAMLPPKVFEYVVIHELAHIRYHNHSPAFWDEVERWLPGYRALKALLRDFERRIDW
jgi:predicted metal-dependent hydrolase